jgi:hypothetical protein
LQFVRYLQKIKLIFKGFMSKTTEVTEREIELDAILKCWLPYTVTPVPVFLILSRRQAAGDKGERLVGHHCAGTS